MAVRLGVIGVVVLLVNVIVLVFVRPVGQVLGPGAYQFLDYLHFVRNVLRGHRRGGHSGVLQRTVEQEVVAVVRDDVYDVGGVMLVVGG